MGCISFPSWIAIVTAIVLVAIVSAIIVVNRKWEAIKFFLFMKFKILIHDDGPENVDEMDFDVFIAYR